MEERISLKGHWTIEIREHGELVKRIDIDNQLTEAYKGSILNQLVGVTAVDLSIKYIALGTGSTQPTAQDTELENEVYRSVPTSKSQIDGYVQTIWVVPTNQANIRIREIGVFCGEATSTPDSGTLLSRIVVDIDKTSSMELTMVRRDYVTI